MNRRQFLKYTGLAGCTLFTKATHANIETPQYWVFINAQGGWDVTLFCDPKGDVLGADGKAPNSYSAAEIREYGEFRYAPIKRDDGRFVLDDFFRNYAQDLIVINGVETYTNNHVTGLRNIWSGAGVENYPSIGALTAAALNPNAPMSYISFGGYDHWADLNSPIHVADGKTIAYIADPNRPWVGDEITHFLDPNLYERIRETQQHRLARLYAEQTLPDIRRSMQLLMNARNSHAGLERFEQHLPKTLDNSSNRLIQQAQTVIAAFKADLCISANLNMGGFDTHANNDQNQTLLITQLVDGIDFLFQEAERQGIREKLMVVVGSDFSRTPYYNSGLGKDHWSSTSLLVLGHPIKGHRVIGATDEDQRPLRVDLTNMAVSASGEVLSPAIIHHALRDLAGVSQHEVSQRYPLTGPGMSLRS